MSDVAIKVENISKAYRIGLREQRHDTLGAVIASWAKRPLQNFKRLRNLSRFDGYDAPDVFWALRDVSFEVKHGEVLGIIGKNGAGKSTLLKILARITEPTQGRAEVYGRIASLLEVGTGFNPELTGRENVYLNGTILGMTKKEIDQKLDEIVDFSGVEQFLDTPVKRYSSGMKVRLAFAVAAHLDPEILIIDEVLAVGDAEFQKKCLGKMQDVAKKEGRTVLFVSHDMGAIQKLCSKTALLKNGKITLFNNTEDAIQKYLNSQALTPRSYTFGSDKNILMIEDIKWGQIGKGNMSIENFIYEGGVFFIEITLKSRIDIKSIAINFRIRKPNNTIVSSVSNYHINKIISLNKGSNTVRCYIPDFPLAEGEYGLTFEVINLANHDKLLEIDSKVPFSVIPGDFFNTGKSPAKSKKGCILLKSYWEYLSHNC